MDRVRERDIAKSNTTVTRHQEETRWTESGKVRRIEIDARTPHAEQNNPETTRKVKIKNGAVVVYERKNTRPGDARSDMDLNTAINDARTARQTDQPTD